MLCFASESILYRYFSMGEPFYFFSTVVIKHWRVGMNSHLTMVRYYK